MNTRERHRRFIESMEEAGYEVDPDYHGRYYYVGPAVRVGSQTEIQDVIRSTPLTLQWDQMGLGYIVYPANIG